MKSNALVSDSSVMHTREKKEGIGICNPCYRSGFQHRNEITFSFSESVYVTRGVFLLNMLELNVEIYFHKRVSG